MKAEWCLSLTFAVSVLQMWETTCLILTKALVKIDVVSLPSS